MMHKVSLSEITIIGFRISCPFGEFVTEIPKARQELIRRISEIDNIVNTQRHVGIHKEVPSNEYEAAYFIGYEVEKVASVPKDMISITVYPQTYGKINYQGKVEKIHGAYDELSHWMMQEQNKINYSNWTVEKIATDDRIIDFEQMYSINLDIFIPIK
ncbi:hypothetical protein BACCIP111883_03351 [Sutcliffiella rhizosphaerae]|uniref:Integron-associated effector binding protein domain-containing protein n=2 Tax=Sutcliffiella rhizosphaerae TaxID=2880967 RepID=A0ABM8YRX4_9BACI|nr:hypothetical protein BACCIP111883_03351 [Sutcliffiella rhizosphaerae]